ncbi:hypothetical protein [Latilactobacillus sakei]|uniref:hypothetical protein n=1 Tax=Latilactobacillus sakei TaxID=1599 RepID=UPI00097645D3|nr:hypothetical protein [Latilactobacillus sakei]
MPIFMKEQAFLDFLTKTYPQNHFEKGYSVFSINLISTTPVMSVVYIGDECVAAARYNQSMGFFSDPLLITSDHIIKLEMARQGTGDRMRIETDEKMADGTPMTLTLNIASISLVAWHQRNLSRLKKCYSVKR